MADIWSRQKRSEVMAKIRGHGNRSTELRLIHLFSEHGITGWRRRQRLPGNPDFVFRRERLCVFVDGCFWHGCPSCATIPKTRRKFWLEKIGNNKRRDARVTRKLRAEGWAVIRIRECRLRKYPEAQVRRIEVKLARKV